MGSDKVNHFVMLLQYAVRRLRVSVSTGFPQRNPIIFSSLHTHDRRANRPAVVLFNARANLFISGRVRDAYAPTRDCRAHPR